MTMPDTSGLGDSRTGLITIPVSEFEKINSSTSSPAATVD